MASPPYKKIVTCEMTKICCGARNRSNEMVQSGLRIILGKLKRCNRCFGRGIQVLQDIYCFQYVTHWKGLQYLKRIFPPFSRKQLLNNIVPEPVTDDARWNTTYYSVWWHVLGNHCVGPHDGSCSDTCTLKNHRPITNPDIIHHDGMSGSCFA